MKNFTAAHFLSRELSWLEFNQRVLNEALDKTNPLLERVKFFTITSSNLDEFFEVRVAGIKQQIESDIVERSPDGRTSTETFRAIRKKVLEMVDQQFRCWRDDLVPALAKYGMRSVQPQELKEKDRAWLENYYRAQVRPVLTPLGIDPAHPFPQLLNKSLNIVVQLEIERNEELQRRYAVVQVPRVLPRLVRLPATDDADRHEYVYMGHLISFRERASWGSGISASRGTASCTSTKTMRRICSARWSRSCTIVAKARRCGWRWITIARRRFTTTSWRRSI